ncbi:ulp1 protease family, C-terminal catalytic domain-containing protein [Tanacetum coccineum]
MLDNVIKLPFMSVGIIDEQKGLAADAPTSSNTSKITLIQNSDGHFHVKKNDKSYAAKKATAYVLKQKNLLRWLNERSRVFDENVTSILENAGKKNFNDVELVFFPSVMKILDELNHYYIICFDLKYGQIDIIDNIYNDDEDITARYGIYAMALIDSFINYLERVNHSKISELLKAKPKQVPMYWKTTNYGVDCGVFMMRHMESYMGHGHFVHKFKKEGAGQKPEIKILHAKYLIKILLIDFNLKKENLLKEAEKIVKKKGKNSRIITKVCVKVDKKVMKRLN